jgi:ribose 5-phosphate isomerase RpiB
MKISVITEVSTRDKNKAVVASLNNRGHEVYNLGMTGSEGEQELTYIGTGFMAAAALGSGCVDLVVGGCGTGQGFLNSALQYPGVFCGLIENPLDSWLFAQINGGNCISLALNKGFGWAGDVNLSFIFDRLFSVELGCGYPAHRQTSQQHSRSVLSKISELSHLPMAVLVDLLPKEVVEPALAFPGFMEFLRNHALPGSAVLAACEKRWSLR